MINTNLRKGLLASLLFFSSAANAIVYNAPDVSGNVTGGTDWTLNTSILNVATSSSSDATLTLTNIWGDFNSSNETLKVSIEGTSFFGPQSLTYTNTGNPDCGSFADVSITIPQAALASIISDGQINIEYTMGNQVDYCTAGGTSVNPGGRKDAEISATIEYTASSTTSSPSSPSSLYTAQFLKSRSSALLNIQPEVVRFVDGRVENKVKGSGTDGNGNIDAQFVGPENVWVDLTGRWSNNGNSKQHFGLATIGSHARVGNNTIVGGMLQLDTTRWDSGSIDIDGLGWSAGVYFASQIADNPLYVDGRLLYGKSKNTLNKDTDFDGDRILATLGIEGKLPLNDKLSLLPVATVKHVRETQDTFVDANNVNVAKQSVRQTEASMGLRLEALISQSNTSNHMFTSKASAVWSDFNISGESATVIKDENNWSGKLEIGYRFNHINGVTFDINAFADGLGEGDKDGHGGSFMFNYKF